MDDTISRQAALRTDCFGDGHDGLRAFHVYEDYLKMRKYLESLPPAQPEQQWIPCSERLPEDDTEVFVYLFDRPSPFIAWIEDCHWYTEEFEVEKDNYPLAWLPLPEPYKGGREE